MAEKITIKWMKPLKKIIAEAINEKDFYKFAAVDWHRLYFKYAPMRTGTLAGDVQYVTDSNKAVIRHVSPYAHRLYNCEGMNFSKEKHALASARWDQAAKQAGAAAKLAADLQAFIKRGG